MKKVHSRFMEATFFPVIFFMEKLYDSTNRCGVFGVFGYQECRSVQGSHFFQNPFCGRECGEGSHSGDGFILPVETGKTSQNADRLEDQIDQSRCQISLCGMGMQFSKVCRSDFGGEAGDGTGADVTHQQIHLA